jgi:hypothetical protein
MLCNQSVVRLREILYMNRTKDQKVGEGTYAVVYRGAARFHISSFQAHELMGAIVSLQAGRLSQDGRLPLRRSKLVNSRTVWICLPFERSNS